MTTRPELDELRKRLEAIAYLAQTNTEGTTLDAVAPDEWIVIMRDLATIEFAAQKSIRIAAGVARSVGVTWEAIGATLGMTKQGAQKRFGMELI